MLSTLRGETSVVSSRHFHFHLPPSHFSLLSPQTSNLTSPPPTYLSQPNNLRWIRKRRTLPPCLHGLRLECWSVPRTTAHVSSPLERFWNPTRCHTWTMHFAQPATSSLILTKRCSFISSSASVTITVQSATAVSRPMMLGIIISKR